MQVKNRAIKVPQPDFAHKNQPPDFPSERTTTATFVPPSILKGSRLLITGSPNPKAKTVSIYEPKPGDLEKLVIIPLTINGLKVRALLDSGASVSLMAEPVAKKLIKQVRSRVNAAASANQEIREMKLGVFPTRSKISEGESTLTLRIGDGRTWELNRKLVNARVQCGSSEVLTGLWLFPNSRPNYDVILGVNLLKALGFVLEHPDLGPMWNPKEAEICRKVLGAGRPLDEITERFCQGPVPAEEISAEEGGIVVDRADSSEPERAATPVDPAQKENLDPGEPKRVMVSPMDIWGKFKDCDDGWETPVQTPEFTLLDDGLESEPPERCMQTVVFPEPVVMPPHSCKLVQFPLNEIASTSRYFEPNLLSLKRGVNDLFMTPSFISTGADSVQVELRNAGPNCVSVPPGRPVGWILPATIFPVPGEQKQPGPEVNRLEIVDVEERKRRITELVDFSDTLIADDRGRQCRFLEILHKHSTVFVCTETEIGKVKDGTEFDVDTGDAEPLTANPRPQTPETDREVQENISQQVRMG